MGDTLPLLPGSWILVLCISFLLPLTFCYVLLRMKYHVWIGYPSFSLLSDETGLFQVTPTGTETGEFSNG